MRIVSVESTDLFAGTAQRPLQLIRVTLVNEGAGMLATPAMSAAISVQGPGVRDPGPFGISGMNPGEQKAFEVPVEIAAPYQPGSTRQVTVTVTSDAGRTEAEAGLTVAEPGWTMWMVSHFHYDPVWWNTQGQFTEARLALPDEDGELPDVRSAFELVGAHLDKARRDADYKFILAEIDYLKPYFDAFPQDREDLRRLMAEGRVEIVGGNYNEPNTNLISAEAIIRNAVYGVGFQRDVFGGDPRSAWMIDAFGHDPGYPGLMAAAGLTSSAWARGPFHQWGPSGAEGGDRRMQFSTEFEWISPDGGGLLTAYMAHHYGAGWRLHAPPDLVAAELEAYGQFRGLAQVATTRNVLLPVGSDHVIPARWVTDIHRDWNQRYVWPRFVTAVPREFFDAVRAEAAGPGSTAWISPQTRDMNPVYTGKDVSYIDTKQGQRAIETAVTEAERLGTLAWLAGAPYPHAALDKAWRILAYGAHHDAITGVESDQVYLDLLGSWREAWELASAARRDAAAYLAGPARDTGLAITVVNGLARPRDGMARVTIAVDQGGIRWLELRDDTSGLVPALAEGVRRRDDGSLAEVTLTFRARDVPGARDADLPAAGGGHRRGRMAAGRRDGDRERRLPGHRGSGARRDGQRHRQAHRHPRADRTRQRAGHPGRVRAAPTARRGSLAPGAQGTRARLVLGTGHGAGRTVPGGFPASGLVQPGRARRDPGDGAVGSRRPGRVPHPRGRLRRARPPAAGALPGRRAGRAAGLPDRHGGDRPVVRGGGRGLGRPLVHAGQSRVPVVRARFGGARHGPQRAGPGDRGGRGRLPGGTERAG